MTHAAAATALYRRFLRVLRAHPRHRVKLALLDETRAAFALRPRPSSSSSSTRASALARGMLALTFLKRAGANARGPEGELLYHLMSLRDSAARRRDDRAHKGARQAGTRERASGDAERAVMGGAYGVLRDVIGVRGVAGADWSTTGGRRGTGAARREEAEEGTTSGGVMGRGRSVAADLTTLTSTPFIASSSVGRARRPRPSRRRSRW